MSEPIMCKCKNVVYHYDGKSTMPITTRCSVCGRYIRFNPLDKMQRTKIVASAERKMSSGIRFY